MNKLSFIVYIDVGFADALTGGVVAMHQLAKKISDLGEDVIMITKPEYDSENIKIKDISYIKNLSDEDKKKHVIIYPQIILGNPMQIPNVARWILYDTDINQENSWEETDEYFNFGSFNTIKKKTNKKLTVFNYYFELFQNKKNKRKKTFCHLLHKHTPIEGTELLYELNSENLGNWKSLGCHDYLNDRLNDCEYFLTYDQKSFFPLAAGLCGAKTIILNPDNKITPNEYRLQNPIQMYGVAYGWDDISWAKKTIDMVRSNLKELEKNDDKTVDYFVKYWYDKINFI